MADVLALSVSNMVTHLEAHASTLGCSRVDGFASYRLGTGGPAISVEVAESPQVRLVAVSAPTLSVEWVVPMYLSYWSEHHDLKEATANAYSVMSKIIAYLLANHNPNSYGELLIEGDSLAAGVIALPTDNPDVQLTGGRLRVVLVVQDTVTMI